MTLLQFFWGGINPFIPPLVYAPAHRSKIVCISSYTTDYFTDTNTQHYSP